MAGYEDLSDEELERRIKELESQPFPSPAQPSTSYTAPQQPTGSHIPSEMSDEELQAHIDEFNQPRQRPGPQHLINFTQYQAPANINQFASSHQTPLTDEAQAAQQARDVAAATMYKRTTNPTTFPYILSPMMGGWGVGGPTEQAMIGGMTALRGGAKPIVEALAKPVVKQAIDKFKYWGPLLAGEELVKRYHPLDSIIDALGLGGKKE